MLKSKINLSARRVRIRKLRGESLSSPRCKLAIQTLFLAVFVLFAPAFLPHSASAEIAGVLVSDSGLAIDSLTFALDTLAMTEDGFLIKNAGQTTKTNRNELSDIFAYTVEKGDTLSGIAYQFGVSSDTIVWENDVSNPHNLKPGTTLNILPVSGITYAIKEGDTLEKIAKKYGIKVENLIKQNQLEEKDAKLVASTKIIIPGGKRTISTGTRLIASRSPGTYAAYRSPKPIDGAVIVSNSEKNKEGKWMIKPTTGIYTTYFGGRPNHWAVDIADRGMPAILSAADGTVVKSQCGWNGGYGCVIVVDHGDGYQTLYAHLSKLYVGVNKAIKQGDAIGKMGATGRVWGKTGIHLHFEVIAKGVKKNPLAFYNE